jgi:hypothetical protein
MIICIDKRLSIVLFVLYLRKRRKDTNCMRILQGEFLRGGKWLYGFTSNGGGL